MEVGSVYLWEQCWDGKAALSSSVTSSYCTVFVALIKYVYKILEDSWALMDWWVFVSQELVSKVAHLRLLTADKNTMVVT